MKKLFLIIVPVLFALIPMSCKAAEFSKGETVSISANQTIDHDLIIAGSKSVTVDGTIKGDLTVFGQDITINGKVEGDVFAAGDVINLNGDFKDDVRVAGGAVNVNGKIADDLFAASTIVNVAEKSIISGSSYLACGSLIIDGQTGEIKTYSDNITLNKTAVINGNFSYESSKKATINNGAKIVGGTNKKINEPSKFKNVASTGRIIYILITLLFAIILVKLFPKASKKMAEYFKTKGFDSVVKGFVALFIIPIASILLLISVIGIPLGLMLLLVYPILLFLGNLIGIYSLGNWINQIATKRFEERLWIPVLIGGIVYYLLGMVPFAGPLFCFLVFCGGIGTFISYLWILPKKIAA